MTGRKPPGVTWESWTERQIREGIERGEFDNLSGAGKPLPGLDDPHDDLWWVREKLRREEVSALPPTLAVCKELDEARVAIAVAGTEAEVRRIIAAINDRIRHVNRYGAAGPPSNLMPLDTEAVVARWAASRHEPPSA